MKSTTPAHSAMTICPGGKTLGAEIGDIDLRSITSADFAAIHQAWNDHSVLLFRGQHLTDDDLIAFSRRFGDLDWAPVQETGRRFVEGYPEIYVVSNVIVNGEPIGSLGAGEATWHTDMSYLELRPKQACCMRWKFLLLAAIHISAECITPTTRSPTAETPRRGTDAQARRHLQQRWIPAPGRHGC